MRSNKIFIAVITLILSISAITYGQKAEIKKFEFMKGEFKTRGTDGMVKADFDKSGNVFRWKYESVKLRRTATVSYDPKRKAFYMMETNKGLNMKYFRGFETTDGIHFYQLNSMGGIIDADGEELKIKPLEDAMVRMVRYRKTSNSGDCKAGFVTEYYPKDYSDEMIAKQTRKAIKMLDFLAGTFNEDSREGQVIGKYEDDGMKYVWAFKSPRNSSDAFVTYDFHKDEYTLVETVAFGNRKTITKYVGSFDSDGKLNLISDEGDTVYGLTLSQPNKNKVLMKRTMDLVENYSGTYTRVP